MRKSLAFRVIALSGIWIIMALVVTGLLLVYFYKDHTVHHFDEHIAMHFEELRDASGFLPDGTFELARRPSDPRYQDVHSGWYWEVQQSGSTLARSRSLGGASLDLGTLVPGPSVSIHEITGPVGENLRLHVSRITEGPGLAPLVLLGTAPMTGVSHEVRGYSGYVITSLLALGAGLVLVVVLQVRIALKPLNEIGAAIASVRAGESSHLPRDYPRDVQPLVDELNNLIEHNRVLLKRCRNRLGDLAHAVKNPLTVINNEARSMENPQKDLILQQTDDIGRHVDHCLTRARAFGATNVLGSRSEVGPVMEDLVYAMQRIHRDRALAYDCTGVCDCWFRGDQQDLEEMLGNLVDNASKWASSRVVIRCVRTGERLAVSVEDDGPGIAEGEIQNVMQRGVKLDESMPGHGQGLGIIKDIAGLYGGSLKLSKSKLGGLSAELDLPAA